MSEFQPLNGSATRLGSHALAAVTWVFAAYSVLPSLINLFIVGRPAQVLTVAVAEQTATAPLALLARTLLKLLLFAICSLAILDWFRLRTAQRFGTIIPLLVLWIVVLISTLGHGAAPRLAMLTLPIVAMAVRASGSDARSMVHMGRVGAAIAGVSLVMALSFPTLAYVGNDAAKLLSSGLFLAGPLSHPNALGQVMALTLPFVAYFERGRLRLLESGAMLAVLVMSGSRTSLLALGAGLLCAVLLGAVLPWTGLASKRLATQLVLLTSVLFGVVDWFMVRTAGPTAYAGRGQIWTPSLQAWSDSIWFGLGSDFYFRSARLVSDLLNVSYHGHNQLVHVLTVSGIAGLAAMIVVLFASFRRSAAASWRTLGMSWLVVWLVLGTFEVPSDFLSLTTISMFSWIPIAFFLTGEMRFERNRCQSLAPLTTEGCRETSRAPRQAGAVSWVQGEGRYS